MRRHLEIPSQPLQQKVKLPLSRLWNELTISCLKFVFHHSAKGKITFAFYSDFVKRFQKSIDQINLLKLIRESLVSLSSINASMKTNKSLNFLIVWRKMHRLKKSKLLSLLSKDFSALDLIFPLPHSWSPKLRNTSILIKMSTATSSLHTTDFAIPSTQLKGNSNCSTTRPCNI